MKIIFLRADGNAKIGMGHLMRLMTVAEHFDRHTRVVFLCADEISAETVRNHGFEARALGTSYQNMESEIPVLQKIMAEYAGAGPNPFVPAMEVMAAICPAPCSAKYR